MDKVKALAAVNQQGSEVLAALKAAKAALAAHPLTAEVARLELQVAHLVYEANCLETSIAED